MPPTALCPFNASSPAASDSARTRAAFDRVAVETRCVDVAVEQIRLGAVARADRLEPALAEQPFEHEAGQIPTECVRRVEQRSLRSMLGIAEDLRQCRWAARQQVVADDHDDEPGGTDVLLGAGVDDAEA